jgi:hypothetical protein
MGAHCGVRWRSRGVWNGLVRFHHVIIQELLMLTVSEVATIATTETKDMILPMLTVQIVHSLD